MKLGELLGSDLDVGQFGELEISTVEIDSRRCVAGSLFFAVSGGSLEGATFVDDAIARGAVAVIAERELVASIPQWSVSESDIHDLLVRASARIVGHPERSLTLVGVTGTNGKTSVTTMLAALWRAVGHAGEAIGTLTHERTTPASPELFRELARIERSAVGRSEPLVALEVSSHALTQRRVDGLSFDVAIFTNLSHDHLDYHGTFEEYFEAKASLFTPQRARRAVIWADDEYGRRLLDEVEVPTVAVRREEARDVHYEIGSTQFIWRDQQVRVPLSGEFNLDNILLVLAAAVVLGVSPTRAASAVSQVAPVPGRFEIVRRESPTVIVDYAHTPDGLERLLGDVRSLLPSSRCVLVFGCGGDRDRTKRPMMGEVATRLADETILTSDNPRTEDPDLIINEIANGCASNSSWRRIRDRREAIRDALANAGANDVVIIAGKGHETTQTIGSTVIGFDDRLVAKEFLK